jgi:hypothetical protein
MAYLQTTVSPSAQRGSHVGRIQLVVGTLVTFVGTFLFRFLTIEFINDHFQHLARGRQILLGELPVRDFFDPGLIGQYYASAAALLWSGHNLYGEGLLNVFFIAAGAALNFYVAARVSTSVWIALASTFLVVISMPRLYSYPKLFFYVAGLAGAWRYANRPTLYNLVVLGGIIAVAFLFRHDHGVYVGLSLVALMVIVHFPRIDRGLVRWIGCGIITCVFLLPWMIFVQSTAGLPSYFTGITPQMQHVSTVRFNWLPVAIDRSAPLYTTSPPPEQRINVRWHQEVGDSLRHARETKYGLTNPDRVEGSTWSYVASDERPETIRAIVNDPLVLDTHGIDRQHHEIAVRELWYERLQRWVPLLRTHVLPGVFTRQNGLAWFYYVTVALPFIALVFLAAAGVRGTVARPEAAVVAMAILLSVIVVQTLVRGSPDSRMADVSSPTAVLGAWIASRIVPRRGVRWRPVGVATAVAVFGISAWSVGTEGRAGDALMTSGMLRGPESIAWQWDRVTERLKARPISIWERTDNGVRALGRYVFECTNPADRILVTWFAPEIFFYSERGFAGGQVYLRARWHASESDQRLTIARMQQERVPLVLVREDVSYEYQYGFPLVYEHVQRHYARATPASNLIDGYQVWVDRQLTPTGTYEPLGLPCYR